MIEFPEPGSKLYIAGPMGGCVDLNHPAFHDAARLLRNEGYEITNPAEIDETVEERDRTWGHYLARDVAVILQGGLEGVAMLPGWRASRGAQLEGFAAQCIRIPLFDFTTREHILLKPTWILPDAIDKLESAIDYAARVLSTF